MFIEWEYYSILLDLDQYVDSQLNDLGREGWELVTICSRMAYFKRPIRQ